MIKDLIIKNRSNRRFHQEVVISRETLEELVDLARMSGSAGNRQPLKYLLSYEPEKNSQIFLNIGLAGSPREGERPSAYIVILGDTEIGLNFGADYGIAAQSILLGAVETGLGGCMIGMINRRRLKEALHIPPRYEILLVIALGKPKEKVVLETLEPGGNVQGYRDEHGVRHVPKRALKDIIIG